MSDDTALEFRSHGQTGYAWVPNDDGQGRLLWVDAGKEVMRFKSVSTLDDVMQLRQLRNECREFMTQNTEEISEGAQLMWWQNVAGNQDWRVWLVYVPGWEEAVGFALLRRSGARWYATLGLRQWLRGQGYGTLIYQMLRAESPEDVWAAIKQENTASVRAAEKAGYKPSAWSIEGQVAMVGRKGR